MHLNIEYLDGIRSYVLSDSDCWNQAERMRRLERRKDEAETGFSDCTDGGGLYAGANRRSDRCL